MVWSRNPGKEYVVGMYLAADNIKRWAIFNFYKFSSVENHSINNILQADMQHCQVGSLQHRDKVLHIYVIEMGDESY